MPTENMLDTERVYTLNDLERWSTEQVSLAVLGSPIVHSRSPRMQNAALAMLAKQDTRFANWRYYKFDVHPDNLEQALKLFHAKGFHGLNLTVPHKVHAVPMVRVSSPDIEVIGAVNTLKWTKDGYVGYNTDGFGLSRALTAEFSKTSESMFANREVILLGAGGAARGAAFQALHEGCSTLWIGNRNQDRLNELLKILEASANRLKGFDLQNVPASLPKKQCLIINATSLGMKKEDVIPMAMERFGAEVFVYDMVYSPPKTLLLEQAEKRGIKNANGLSMLVWQGAKAMQIWIDAYVEQSENLLNELASCMQKSLAV